MSHKRISSLCQVLEYYQKTGIDVVCCDNSPQDYWNNSRLSHVNSMCELYGNHRLTFYDQLLWLAERFYKLNEPLIHICPDEDIHYHKWLYFCDKFYTKSHSLSPVSCIYGPALNFSRTSESTVCISNAMPSQAFSSFGSDMKSNAMLSMLGQVPFLWRTYPTDFFLSLMSSVKWFALKYGDKVAEQVVWNLLTPALGIILQPNKYVHFIRRDSVGLRFQGLANIGWPPFVEVFKDIDHKKLALEIDSHCRDFPSRYKSPGKDFFNKCLAIASTAFRTRPWLCSKNNASCFYVAESESVTHFSAGRSDFVVGKTEEREEFNYWIASALNMPLHAFSLKDLPLIYNALSE